MEPAIPDAFEASQPGVNYSKGLDAAFINESGNASDSVVGRFVKVDGTFYVTKSKT